MNSQFYSISPQPYNMTPVHDFIPDFPFEDNIFHFDTSDDQLLKQGNRIGHVSPSQETYKNLLDLNIFSETEKDNFMDQIAVEAQGNSQTGLQEQISQIEQNELSRIEDSYSKDQDKSKYSITSNDFSGKGYSQGQSLEQMLSQQSESQKSSLHSQSQKQVTLPRKISRKSKLIAKRKVSLKAKRKHAKKRTQNKRQPKRVYSESLFREQCPDFDNLTEAQKKKERRKIKNRITAQESRDKKQQLVKDLQKKIQEQAEDNKRLRKEKEELQIKLKEQNAKSNQKCNFCQNSGLTDNFEQAGKSYEQSGTSEKGSGSGNLTIEQDEPLTGQKAYTPWNSKQYVRPRKNKITLGLSLFTILALFLLAQNNTPVKDVLRGRQLSEARQSNLVFQGGSGSNVVSRSGQIEVEHSPTCDIPVKENAVTQLHYCRFELNDYPLLKNIKYFPCYNFIILPSYLRDQFNPDFSKKLTKANIDLEASTKMCMEQKRQYMEMETALKDYSIKKNLPQVIDTTENSGFLARKLTRSTGTNIVPYNPTIQQQQCKERKFTTLFCPVSYNFIKKDTVISSPSFLSIQNNPQIIGSERPFDEKLREQDYLQLLVTEKNNTNFYTDGSGQIMYEQTAKPEDFNTVYEVTCKVEEVKVFSANKPDNY